MSTGTRKRIIGFCLTPFVDAWTLEGLRALRSCGFTHARLTPNLARLFPFEDPSTWRLDLMDRLLDDMDAAHLGYYLNPGGCPPWACGGQPIYAGSIAVWPPDAPDIPASYAGTGWWNAPHAKNAVGQPAQFPHGVHWFDQDPNRPDSDRDGVTGEVITGAQLAAIDREMPDRPYLKNPAPRDPRAFALMFRTMAQRWGTRIAFWGIENEPTGYGSAEMHHLDIAFTDSSGGTEDTIRTRYWPVVAAALGAVRDVLPQSKRIGIDADSDAGMRRILHEEFVFNIAKAPHQLDDLLFNLAIGCHPYADFNNGQPSYATTEAFKTALGDSLGRELWCTEIGNPPFSTFEPWFRRTDYPAIFLLGSPWMPTPTIEAARADIAPFVAAFASVNGPVDPNRTTMPVKGRRRSVGK